jgi:hypothetical protein
MDQVATGFGANHVHGRVLERRFVLEFLADVLVLFLKYPGTRTHARIAK